MSTLPTLYELMISKLSYDLNEGLAFTFNNESLGVKFYRFLFSGKGFPSQACSAGVRKQEPDKAGEIMHPILEILF